MTTFLLIAGALAIAVGGLVAWPLFRGRRPALARAEADTAFYRDQLAELDREVARGTLAADEAEGARTEIARRLIAADRDAAGARGPADSPPTLSRGLAVAAIVVPTALAALLYSQIGAPGQPDLPLASRPDPRVAAMPTQEEAEARVADQLPEPPKLDPEYAGMLARLEEVVASRTDDETGHRLLARELARAGRWVEARAAHDKLLDILGPRASAEELADAAGAMVFAAGGYVSPRAGATLDTALALDPQQPMARFYQGFRLRQSGESALAIELWEGLLAEDQAAVEPRGAGWREGLAALIAETRAPDAPGPTREDIEAASRMSADEQAAFVANMVAGLEARLTEEGGKPEEWVRLITAYRQLRQPDDARRILALSQERLDDPTARAFVREQALLMGIEPE